MLRDPPYLEIRIQIHFIGDVAQRSVGIGLGSIAAVAKQVMTSRFRYPGYCGLPGREDRVQVSGSLSAARTA